MLTIQANMKVYTIPVSLWLPVRKSSSPDQSAASQETYQNDKSSSS